MTCVPCPWKNLAREAALVLPLSLQKLGPRHEGDDLPMARGGELDVDDGGGPLRHLPSGPRRLRSWRLRTRRRLSRRLGQGASAACCSRSKAHWKGGKKWRARAASDPVKSPSDTKRVASQTLSLSSQCSHYFHLMCITTWLHNKNSCPICRRKWEFASAPKPAPATPGVRRQGEGFSAAAAAATEPIAPPEPVEAD